MANGVYWVGQDGQTYINAENIPGGAQAWRAPLLTPQQMGLQLIDDPMVAPGPAPTGGGSGGPAPVLNTQAINNTQGAINELGGLLSSALEAEGRTYGNTIKGFDSQEKAQRGQYDESTTTNQQNYDANLMSAVRAGSKGLGGLLSLLRGAALGTAGDQARDAVTEVTAGDIRMGADTRKENQSALDGTLSTFLTGLSEKRQRADDTRANNESAIRRGNLTQEQELYKTMAELFEQGGDTAQAGNWLAKAGGLTPKIAANSRQQVSEYDMSPVEVAAPEIAAFEAVSQPNVTSVGNESGQIGSGIFKIGERRRRQQVAV